MIAYAQEVTPTQLKVQQGASEVIITASQILANLASQPGTAMEKRIATRAWILTTIAATISAIDAERADVDFDETTGEPLLFLVGGP
jgi:hypothetical protein